MFDVESPFVTYVAQDKNGVPLYVGQSHNVNARIKSHKYNSSWYSDDLEWVLEGHDTRIEALRREAALIRDLSPIYNSVIPRLDPENIIPWGDYLKPKEASSLDHAKAKRDKEASRPTPRADEYNALYRKLKSRCESRMRQMMKREAEKDA